jgi:hypothetical protein
MGDFQAPQRTYSVNALGKGQSGRVKTEDYTIKRGELRSVNGEKTAEGRDLRIARSVRVDADGPEAALLLDWSPELLRNPGQAALKKRAARKTVG